MSNYTAFLNAIELSNGGFLQEFIQSTFANRGIIITHFHDTIYQKMDSYRIATIKFDFYIESYTDNQESYHVRMLYRLKKFADDEAKYNAQDKNTRGIFRPSIEPFEMVHKTNPRECWVVKLIHC
uniref:Uncharacterized protein n=1 Tax=viral metagenome TaxID=1070528 RepID=A0A6C0B8H9_9ZZZZ